MNEILERIENTKGILTKEEKAALEEYAESTGAPKEIWQVYDDSNVTDEDYLGTVKAGPQHLTQEAALEWAKEQGFEMFSIYRETRCCARTRQIWYMQASHYWYSSW